MRQVPQYAIIGDGRVARHICHYFSLLGIPYRQWHRRLSVPLSEVVATASHVLVLISDVAIDAFVQGQSCLNNKVVVHFSGSHVSPWVPSAHPLMAFGEVLYDLEAYVAIPFIIEKEGESFSHLLPSLPNPNFSIPRDSKPYYHSLCVMANNFTTMLWQKFFEELNQRFSIPDDMIKPLLMQTAKNISHDYQRALTGPFTRGDKETQRANLSALKDDKFLRVYKAFFDIYSDIEEGEAVI